MRNSAIEDVLDGEDSIRGFLQVSLTQHKVGMKMVVWVKTIVRAGGVIYRVYPVWKAETKMLTREGL